MFGFSFAEVVLLVVVAIVVVGPKQMPAMLRSAGRWVSKIRRMAFDMREQSGIDEILRNEGLDKDIHQLRSLMAMRRGNVIEALGVTVDEPEHITPQPKLERPVGTVSPQDEDEFALEQKEYPAVGSDAAEAVSEELDPYVPVERLKPHSGQSDL